MNKEQFTLLTQEGYDLNILFLLTLTKEQLSSFTSSKIKAWIQTCVRKQLLSEGLEITNDGRRLLAKYSDSPGKEIDVIIDKSEIDEWFEKWWEIYPDSDFFIHKGRTFEGSQAKKVNKTKGRPSNCKDNFRKIVNEGKYSPQDIIRATEFHFNVAKEQSFKQNVNKLTFIANSERYLRETMFAPFVERSKKEVIKEQSTDTFI